MFRKGSLGLLRFLQGSPRFLQDLRGSETNKVSEGGGVLRFQKVLLESLKGHHIESKRFFEIRKGCKRCFKVF